MESVDPRPRRTVRIRALWVPVAAYLVLSLASLLWSNPFGVAVERAAEIGDWRDDQVVFTSGSYGYRLLYSVAEADLEVTTAAGRERVRIEMRNTPLSGWRVSRWARGSAL